MSSDDKIKDHVNLLQDYGLYIPTRSIRLTGAIGETNTDYFLNNLHILDNINNKEITILLKSEGGELDEAKAIYDGIISCSSPVKIVVEGYACSAASLILQAAAGPDDTRCMRKNSYLMLHIGEEYAGGHPKNKEAWDNKYKQDGEWMIDVYWRSIKEKKKRYPKNTLKSKMEFDMIFSPKEALEFGLIDEILGE